MNTLVRTIKWAWKAWPFWLLLFVAALHYLAYCLFSGNADTVNKTIALACQLIGGGLVLLSIDSNLGILRKKDLFGAFVTYLKQFPPINPPRSVKVSGHACLGISATARATVTKNPPTVEGKLEYLQEQIDELRKSYRSSLLELKKENDKNIQDLRGQINAAQRSVSLLERNLDKVSVGGVSLQIFGVILVVYGSITGYMA